MASRSIPKKIKNIILEKFRGRCGFPNCKWPAADLHHTKRFSLVKRHLPEEIVPLCKIHHELAHAGLIGNECGPIGEWFMRFVPDEKTETLKIDKKVQKHKKMAAKIKV